MILLNPLRPRQLCNIHTRNRPLRSKRPHLPPQVPQHLIPLLPRRLHCRDPHEILQHFGPSFFLEHERELDGTVEEGRDCFYRGFLHVAGGESGGAETDPTWDLGGYVARDGVFCSQWVLGEKGKGKKGRGGRTVDGDPNEITHLLHFTTR